jgi:hypothetical protein
LERWLRASLEKRSRKSDTTGAIQYALNLWPALLRYCDDGLIEIDNSTAEQALRGVVIGRRNYLFAGADMGGERAAAIYSLLGTVKLKRAPWLAGVSKLCWTHSSVGENRMVWLCQHSPTVRSRPAIASAQKVSDHAARFHATHMALTRRQQCKLGRVVGVNYLGR